MNFLNDWDKGLGGIGDAIELGGIAVVLAISCFVIFVLGVVVYKWTKNQT